MFDKNTLVAFGKDYVGTQILSENNAITYKLTVKSSNRLSTDTSAFLAVNSTKLVDFKKGFYVCKLTNSGELSETKEFDLSTDLGVSSFKTYVTTAPQDCFLTFASSYEIGSNIEVEAFFKSIGSLVWNNVLINRIKTVSYSAVYIPKLSKITSEGIIYGAKSPKKNYSLELETVFDDISDFGRTGFPGRPIRDSNEYTSSDKTIYRYWPTQSGQPSLLKDYGLKPGDTVSLSAMLLDSRLECFWKLGGANKGTSLVLSSSTGNYEKKEGYSQIPSDADGFMIIASKTKTKTVGKTKSLVLNKTIGQKQNLSPRQIGLNGIRSTEFVQTDIIVKPNNILSVLNMKDKSGITNSQNFKEIKTG